MGDENKQVGILTFICINMGTQNTVNIEYLDFLRRAQNLKKSSTSNLMLLTNVKLKMDNFFKFCDLFRISELYV